MEMGFVPIKRQSLAELNVLKKNKTPPINPFPNKPLILLQCKCFENSKKRRNFWNKQFLLSHSVTTLLEKFLQFPSNIKLSSANCFSLVV